MPPEVISSFYFWFPTITNINMATVRTSEMGRILVPVDVGSWKLTWLQTFQKYVTFVELFFFVEYKVVEWNV
jgi:hypothetical protein